MFRSPQARAWFRTLLRIVALIPVLLGLVVLLLWMLGKPELSALGQGLVPMAPSTALLFCLFGVVVFFSDQRPGHRGFHWAAFWMVLLVAMAALGLSIRRPSESTLGRNISG